MAKKQFVLLESVSGPKKSSMFRFVAVKRWMFKVSVSCAANVTNFVSGTERLLELVSMLFVADGGVVTFSMTIGRQSKKREVFRSFHFLSKAVQVTSYKHP